MKITQANLITIIIYSIVVFFLLFALFIEHRDINCTSFRSSKCGPGCGSAYAAGKPSEGDSIKVLLGKLRVTARYDVNSIIWRRAFIAAVIGAFLVLYVSKKKVPSGLQFGSAFLILYIIFYMVLTFFQRSIAEPALNQVDEILTQVKKELRQGH